nr:unnamed protein product [Callosobruchus analis]
MDSRHSFSNTRNKPYVKPDVSNVKCFNCKMRGHFQSKCPKPRVSCTKCHLLGHEADRCTVNLGNEQLTDKIKLSGTCYFIDCVINDEPIRGFVDSGCAAVTIRESDALKLHLQAEPSLVRLCGYAGGSFVVRSKATINLTVDLASATVDALTVPDNVHDLPAIVGQPCLNNGNITVVEVQLVVEGTTVIPPNFVGHISLSEQENVKDVFVHLCYRNWINNFHAILPCVISASRNCCIPVADISDKPVCYEKGRVLARGYTCTEYSKTPTKPCLATKVTDLPPFTLQDIEKQTDANLNLTITLHEDVKDSQCFDEEKKLFRP